MGHLGSIVPPVDDEPPDPSEAHRTRRSREAPNSERYEDRRSRPSHRPPCLHVGDRFLRLGERKGPIEHGPDDTPSRRAAIAPSCSPSGRMKRYSNRAPFSRARLVTFPHHDPERECDDGVAIRPRELRVRFAPDGDDDATFLHDAEAPLDVSPPCVSKTTSHGATSSNRCRVVDDLEAPRRLTSARFFGRRRDRGAEMARAGSRTCRRRRSRGSTHAALREPISTSA
jgi:hypothetical protein